MPPSFTAAVMQTSPVWSKVIDSVTSPFSPGDIVNSSVSSATVDEEQSPFEAGSYNTTLAV